MKSYDAAVRYLRPADMVYVLCGKHTFLLFDVRLRDVQIVAL
jgi:hypothetical protein